MDREKNTVLESTDMCDNGTIATFADGKSGFYSATLLRSIFHLAEEIVGTEDDAIADANWKRGR